CVSLHASVKPRSASAAGRPQQRVTTSVDNSGGRRSRTGPQPRILTVLADPRQASTRFRTNPKMEISWARGIYPPLLADLGLAAALAAQASKSPLPVTVEADGI